MSTPIVTITVNPAIDESTSIDHVVVERKLRCAAPRFDPGGGGLNVSRALRKLGQESVAIHLAGGPPGDLLERLVSEEGVAQRPVRIEGWTRENLVVLEEASQQQYRFGFPGPRVSEPEWERCLETIRELTSAGTIVVASGSLAPGLPRDFYARAARCVAGGGGRFVLDTSGDALTAGLVDGVYLLKCNLRELGQATGMSVEHEPAIEAAAGAILARGVPLVVVSLGAGGALLASAAGYERVASPTVPIRSKVGAGDSMVAGMVLALERGLPPDRMVRRGVAAGAAAVMTPGTELCRRDDFERLVAAASA